jgi:hypothetical protein
MYFNFLTKGYKQDSSWNSLGLMPTTKNNLDVYCSLCDCLLTDDTPILLTSKAELLGRFLFGMLHQQLISYDEEEVIGAMETWGELLHKAGSVLTFPPPDCLLEPDSEEFDEWSDYLFALEDYIFFGDSEEIHLTHEELFDTLTYDANGAESQLEYIKNICNKLLY